MVPCWKRMVEQGLCGRRSRIDLQNMGIAHLLRLGAIILLSASQSFVMGQVDTTAMGGPEEVEPYEETGAGPDIDDEASADIWTAADSAYHIPGYTTYQDWNTDVIFKKRAPVTDTVDLKLSWGECDTYMPVCGQVTSPFGIRHGHHHYGTDLRVQFGQPIMCAFPGMVRISRYHREFGNVVVVRHANGLETLYAHMSARSVETGDIVEAGDVVGLGGSTGRSTGNHLHFETRYLGHPIDPQLLFDVDAGVLRSTTVTVDPKLFSSTRTNSRSGTHSYTVRKGDTLSSISRRVGISVSSLCKMNRISANGTLRVGQRIKYN